MNSPTFIGNNLLSSCQEVYTVRVNLDRFSNSSCIEERYRCGTDTTGTDTYYMLLFSDVIIVSCKSSLWSTLIRVVIVN